MWTRPVAVGLLTGWLALCWVTAPVPGASGAANLATPVPGSVGGCAATPLVTVPGAAPYFADLALGRDPVWLIGGGPVLAPADGDHTGAAAGVRFSGDARYGWFQKRLWVIGSGATAPVTIRGHRGGDGLPMWFGVDDRGTTTEVVLDPAHPAIPVQHGAWREYPSYVFFPATGCYEIEASWTGGSWTATVPFVAPPPEAPAPVASCPVEPTDVALACLRVRPTMGVLDPFGGRCPPNQVVELGAMGAETPGPTSDVDREALGSGPVYLGLAKASQLGAPIVFTRAGDGPWATAPISWIVSADTDDLILLRGFAFEAGPNPVGFADPVDPDLPSDEQLLLPTDMGQHGAAFREQAGRLAVQSSGCYMVQADGPEFSEAIAFEASAPA